MRKCVLLDLLFVKRDGPIDKVITGSCLAQNNHEMTNLKSVIWENLSPLDFERAHFKLLRTSGNSFLRAGVLLRSVNIEICKCLSLLKRPLKNKGVGNFNVSKVKQAVYNASLSEQRLHLWKKKHKRALELRWGCTEGLQRCCLPFQEKIHVVKAQQVLKFYCCGVLW